MTAKDVPQPLDLWLARQLRARNDAVLRERAPEDLLRLIVPPSAAPGADRPLEAAGRGG